MRRIFITGASSGIGQALALKLAQEGSTLGLAARREQRLEEVAAQVEQAGGRAVTYPVDVRDYEAQRLAIQDFAEDGGLDAAVANAGFGLTKPILETTPEQAHQLFDVNFFGLLYTLQSAAPYLKKGTFVGISSILTYVLPTGYGVYSATKSAVSALLTTAHRETKGRFQVVLVNPGATKTEFWQVAEKKSGSLIPVTSPIPLAKPEKVAEVITKVITHPKPEVFVTKFEGFLPILRGAFPGILEQYLKITQRGV